MNTIRIKRVSVIVFLLCLTPIMKASMRFAQLNKVYHHKGDEKDVTQLELGKLVFYFSHAPKIDRVSASLAGDSKRIIFFFPHTQVKAGACEKMIAALNDGADGSYRIRIEAVDKPAKGVRFIVSYNPKKVGLSYDTFDSISRQKGIVFHFYNKELIKQLRTKSKPVLRTAARMPTPAVIIDCGHGGRDPGVISSHIHEKDLTLQVGSQLAQLLRKQGVEVFLTRQTDATVALDQRTSMANAHHADLFVSIHANGALQKQRNGIETYCVAPSLFTQRFSSLQSEDNHIVTQLFHDRHQQSSTLAKQVHDSLLGSVRAHNTRVVDLQVKNAIAQVLLGATMPATLVEIGFLSHEHEAQLLARPSYQQTIARGICNGVMAYLRES